MNAPNTIPIGHPQVWIDAGFLAPHRLPTVDTGDEFNRGNLRDLAVRHVREYHADYICDRRLGLWRRARFYETKAAPSPADDPPLLPKGFRAMFRRDDERVGRPAPQPGGGDE